MQKYCTNPSTVKADLHTAQRSTRWGGVSSEYKLQNCTKIRFRFYFNLHTFNMIASPEA
ncbi:hypothetical protein I79_003074 [Cricetulus griseus]|uniref:Uncharacterized protein n=1 Tax=Cricetulus griseus TaxID=10029 RepID=G3GZ23_CRIGR|nr:hypothetical protein I79_003074 [Cricetulus griseus]